MDKGGEIVIRVSHNDKGLIITISNNLEIHSPTLNEINKNLIGDKRDESHKGIGLYNVNHRIKLEYGNNYGLQLNSEYGWTTATITIPKIEGGSDSVKSSNS